jgi:sugar/nucleoside kinase (ribokinase family)
MKTYSPPKKNAPHNVGIVGTFVRDTIVPLSGPPVESIGGLYHTSAYLAHLLGGDRRVRPVCKLGEDFYATVCTALGRFPHFELSSIQRVPMANTHVRLIYRSPETRDEITSAPMPAVTAEEISPLVNCEAVLINLITGKDIELSALRALRQQSSALIYLDLHSLALGIDANGKRYYREVPRWREWIGAVDVLQVNEREAATLAGHDELSFREMETFARQVVEDGLSICNVTLASQGSLLAYRDGETVRVLHSTPHKISQVVDVIGCGDAFGAAFIASYLIDKDAARAAAFANRIAGLNCTFMGSLTPERFRRYIEPHL